ncbi:hypothetical protein CF326_g2704 [Tilletia indica]|nr:hypothetical protein CF326_g2704 [Tilletia indica]
MASAATAPAPTPPSTGTATASHFSRMSGHAVSALFGAVSSNDAPSHGSAAGSSLHPSPRGPTNGSLRPTGMKVGALTTSVPLTTNDGDASVGAATDRDQPTSEGMSPTSRSYSSNSVESSSTTASSSTSTSSWTTAARNASMAPYRVLAAALPNLLNGSSPSVPSGASGAQGTEKCPTSTAAVTETDTNTTPAAAPAKKAVEEEEEEDGPESGAVTAWQSPEMGATLPMAQETPDRRSKHLPSIAGEGRSMPAAAAAEQLIRSLSTASEQMESRLGYTSSSAVEEKEEQAIKRRPSAGLASLVHVHETAPASDSDWEPDSSDEDMESGRSDDVAMPLHAEEVVPSSQPLAFEDGSAHHSLPQESQPQPQPQRRRRRRRDGHGRQNSAFFSVSSVLHPPSSGRGEQLRRPAFPPRTSSLDADLALAGQLESRPSQVLLPSPLIPGDSMSLLHSGAPTFTPSSLSNTDPSSATSSAGASVSAMIGSDALMLGLGLVDMRSVEASNPFDQMEMVMGEHEREELGSMSHRPSIAALSTTAHHHFHGDVDEATEVQSLDGDSQSAPYPAGLVASPISLEGPSEEDRFGLPPTTSASVHHGLTSPAELYTPPKRVDKLNGASSTNHSTPATVVPGTATVVPASPVLDSVALTGEEPLEGEPETETAQQRQQAALARAEHRRELQRYALLELVRTERSYADDLALLVMVFFENLVVLPTFAPAVVNNGSGSSVGGGSSSGGSAHGGNGDMDRSGSRSSGTDGSEDQDIVSAGLDEAGPSGFSTGSGATTLQPPQQVHSRSSSYQPTASGSGPAAMSTSAGSSRNSCDPALERLDLVTRNAEELLSLHQSAAWRLEAIVSQYGLDHPVSDPNVKVKVSPAALEEGTRKVADYLANTLAPALRDLYAPFCSRHMEALAIVKDAERRSAAEWVSYERTCAEILQIVAARMSPTLPSPAQQETSTTTTPTTEVSPSNTSTPSASAAHPTSSPIAPLLNKGNRPHKLVFHDYFVKPIQRIALYPLLLQSLLKYCNTGPQLPGADEEQEQDGGETLGQSNKAGKGKDREAVMGAVEALVGVVEHVNEAGRLRHEERLSQTIVDRIETHYNVTPSFLHSLGHCVVSGTLDVMYHQRHIHPLSTPLRLKYQGCVLYQGFMIIVKVRKSATYEPKYWFPLWLAKLSDVPEESRFLPHAFRLSVRDHHFELVASNARERQLWVDALGEAISQALVHPPGTEAAFPSSLHMDTIGSGEHGSRPSSRATQRASSRLSSYAMPPLPGSFEAELVEEMDPAVEMMGRQDTSPRKGRFSSRPQSHGPIGRSSNPSSPSTVSTAKFDFNSSPNSPAQDGANDDDDVLQQYFEEGTAEIQVRRSSPYQRSIIDRAMAFSASVIGARAPRSTHDYAGASGSLALNNSFALATPAHGPGWQQSLGALVGLGRMGSMETSTLKVQRRKSYAGTYEGLYISPASEALMSVNSSYVGSAGSSSNGGTSSQGVPFPLSSSAGSANGMSNRALRTFRQLSLKTASRGPIRPMSEIPVPSLPSSVPMDGGLTADSNGSDQMPQGLSVPPVRASASRRESFANSLRDALTVSFGRRQRSQSSQDIESESHTPFGTDVGSSGLTSGVNTPYPASMQQSPSLHANLALTPVNGEGENPIFKSGGGVGGNRTDSIRRVFGSMRYRRERTLSMPAPPELNEASEQQPALGLMNGSGLGALVAEPTSSGGASRDSLLNAEGGVPLQVSVSQEDEARPMNPPSRSFSRASLQRSRTALGKIWFGAPPVPEKDFLSVGNFTRGSQLNRRSTDGYVAARSKSALALPTFPLSSSSSSSDGSTGGGHSEQPDSGSRVSRSGADSPNEVADQAIFFSTTSSKKKGGEQSATSSSSGSLASRRPRMNLRLGSSHRRSAVIPPLPTLPATPSEETETRLEDGAVVTVSS